MYEENDVLAQVLERAREDFGRTQRPFQRRPNGVSWTLGKFGKHSSHSPEQIEAAKRLRVLDKSSLFVYSHSCSRGPLLPVLKTRARRLTGLTLRNDLSGYARFFIPLPEHWLSRPRLCCRGRVGQCCTRRLRGNHLHRVPAGPSCEPRDRQGFGLKDLGPNPTEQTNFPGAHSTRQG